MEPKDKTNEKRDALTVGTAASVLRHASADAVKEWPTGHAWLAGVIGLRGRFNLKRTFYLTV